MVSFETQTCLLEFSCQACKTEYSLKCWSFFLLHAPAFRSLQIGWAVGLGRMEPFLQPTL